MISRKYFSELAIGFYSDGILLLHPKDIKAIELQSKQIKDLANDCHIYLIVKRPRMAFVPGSINIEDGKTIGRLKYHNNGIAKEVNFHLAGNAKGYSIHISDYPHNKLFLVKNGVTIYTAPAHLLSIICDHIDDPSIRDLEVVYIGMSYAEGKRSAKDRLQSHSTLQQVLSDINLDYPDTEALIVMAQYVSPQNFISFEGSGKTCKLENDRDVMADIQKQQIQITKNLEISLIEAGLIKYFEPQYNEKYKKNSQITIIKY